MEWFGLSGQSLTRNLHFTSLNLCFTLAVPQPHSRTFSSPRLHVTQEDLKFEMREDFEN